MRRGLSLEEGGEGIQSLDFLLEATGQEVRWRQRDKNDRKRREQRSHT